MCWLPCPLGRWQRNTLPFWLIVCVHRVAFPNPVRLDVLARFFRVGKDALPPLPCTLKLPVILWNEIRIVVPFVYGKTLT